MIQTANHLFETDAFAGAVRALFRAAKQAC